MADFPLNPSVGDVYVSSDFTNWVWDGTAWKATNYGLIKLPVSQNSTGTILANSMNFVNSEQVLANISFDIPSGNANVQFEWLELVDPVAMAIIFGTGSEPNKEIVAGNTDEIMFNYSGEIRTTPELLYNIAANTLTVNTSLFYANGVTGNVGIGTTSPARRLHILGDGTNSPQLRLTYESGTSAIELYGSSASDQIIYFGTSSGGGATTTLPGQIIYNNPANHFQFVTDGVERMRITNTANGGNVGIGTTNPGYKLDVIGTVNVHTLRVANANSIIWSNHDLTTTGAKIEVVGDTMYMETGPVGPGRGAFYLTAHNNMQIGTDDGFIDLRTTTAGEGSYIHFRTGGTDERMRIDYKGNVGIGTTSPTSNLYVTGNSTITQSLNTAVVNASSLVNTQAVYQTSTGIEVFAVLSSIAAADAAQNSALETTNTTFDTVNTAIASAANTVRTSVRGTLISSAKQLNLTNTTPILIAGTNDANGNATIAFTHATSGVTSASYAYPASVTVNEFGHVTGFGAQGAAPITGVQGATPITTSTATGVTTISHATTGAQGTYAYPTSVTVNQFGHVTSVTAGSAPAGGTITGVQAGAGLTGGGATGSINLDVGAGTGITVAADSVSISAANDVGRLSEATGFDIAGGTITTEDSFVVWNVAAAAARRTGGWNIPVEVFSGVNPIGKNLAALSASAGVTFIKVNDNESITLEDAATFRASIGAGTGSGSGTVTGIGTTSPLTNTAGAGNQITTSGSIGLNLEGLTDMTDAAVNTDELVILDRSAASGSQQKRKAMNEIGLGMFNNDLGLGTGSGTVNPGFGTNLAFYSAASGAQGTAVDDVAGHQYISGSKSIVHSEEVRMTSNIADTPVITFTGGTQSSYHITENSAGRVLLSTGAQASTATFGLNLMLLPSAHDGFAVTVVRGTQGSVRIGAQGGAALFSAGRQGNGYQGVAGVQISSMFGAATILANGTNRFIVFGDISNAP